MRLVMKPNVNLMKASEEILKSLICHLKTMASDIGRHDEKPASVKGIQEATQLPTQSFVGKSRQA